MHHANKVQVNAVSGGRLVSPLLVHGVLHSALIKDVRQDCVDSSSAIYSMCYLREVI